MSVTGFLSKTAELYAGYKLLSLIAKPFVEFDAYKLGLIDERGNTIRKSSTQQEKEAMSSLTILAIQFKRTVTFNPVFYAKLKVNPLLAMRESHELSHDDFDDLIKEMLAGDAGGDSESIARGENSGAVVSTGPSTIGKKKRKKSEQNEGLTLTAKQNVDDKDRKGFEDDAEVLGLDDDEKKAAEDEKKKDDLDDDEKVEEGKILTFSQLSNINESYKNLFFDDREERGEYVDQAWDILQKSYKAIGGIKGSGFKSKQDMINGIPFWKLNVVNGKVIAVVMYKDKNGRKLVATGTDGSDKGKASIKSAMTAEMKRSFGEKSKAALGASMKSLDEPLNWVLTTDQAQALSKDRIIPLSKFDGEISEEDAYTIKKYPELRKYMYFRQLGSSWHLKVAFGTPGLEIK